MKRYFFFLVFLLTANLTGMEIKSMNDNEEWKPLSEYKRKREPKTAFYTVTCPKCGWELTSNETERFKSTKSIKFTHRKKCSFKNLIFQKPVQLYEVKASCSYITDETCSFEYDDVLTLKQILRLPETLKHHIKKKHAPKDMPYDQIKEKIYFRTTNQTTVTNKRLLRREAIIFKRKTTTENNDEFNATAEKSVYNEYEKQCKKRILGSLP